MKVSGFTFIRNGSLLGYPFIESILSALPICDEFIVAVGDSEDDTLERIQAIGSNKIRIIQTQWNEKMQDRGFVYAQQKMIAQYNCTGDWAFYLEGDEVLHEDDLPKIRASMEEHLNNPKVEALAFDYHHFFGSPDWVAISPAWYRQECRIIRNTIRSWAPDGLYFVVMDKNKKGRYPRAALVDAPIYHYGHVRSVEAMRKKNERIGKYWKHDHPLFNGYQIDPQALKKFSGNHPKIVKPWLENEAEKNFTPNQNHSLTKREIKHRLAMKLEFIFGRELNKKHFTLIS
ncbi:MAG: glycosyltransferase [Methylophilaceae bacterium]|nr:glycosyltransferase [Methylophilaceae bacterium]